MSRLQLETSPASAGVHGRSVRHVSDELRLAVQAEVNVSASEQSFGKLHPPVESSPTFAVICGSTINVIERTR
jgi:hypothetical protein